MQVPVVLTEVKYRIVMEELLCTHRKSLLPEVYYFYLFQTITVTNLNNLLCRNPLHVLGVNRPSSGGFTLAVFGASCMHL
jgi:hypothetical protein